MGKFTPRGFSFGQAMTISVGVGFAFLVSGLVKWAAAKANVRLPA